MNNPDYSRAMFEKRKAYRDKKYKENPNVYRQQREKYSHIYRSEKYRLKTIDKNKKRRAKPEYRVSEGLSVGIYRSIKDKYRSRAFDLVNYTREELISYLEKQFTEGMTWENYGPDWHIDHIVPLALFRFNSKYDYEFKLCWQLSNLRPLTEFENLSKGDRLPCGRRVKDLTDEERREYILKLFPGTREEQLSPKQVRLPAGDLPLANFEDTYGR